MHNGTVILNPFFGDELNVIIHLIIQSTHHGNKTPKHSCNRNEPIDKIIIIATYKKICFIEMNTVTPAAYIQSKCPPGKSSNTYNLALF